MPGAQFLSMLESLFEKEAKRMEIDMKAAMFGIATCLDVGYGYHHFSGEKTLSYCRSLYDTIVSNIISASYNPFHHFLPPKTVC